MYYFLGTYLPEIKLGKAPEISFEELIFLMKADLSAADFAKTIQMRRYFDIENIRALWLKMPFEKYGNLDENSLEEALLTGGGLPAYVYDFMDKYSSIEERLHHFPRLLATFFQQAIAQSEGFLKEFFLLERDIRLVLTAFRAKQLGKDLLVEMQYENPEDPLVAQILAQKDAKTYEPPLDFQNFKELFNKNPLGMLKNLLEFRFEQWNSWIGLQRFTIDRLLAYLYKLILAEKWVALSQQEGSERVNSLVEDVA